MAWPYTPVAVGDLIQASQLNLLPIQLGDSTLGVAASSFDFTSIPSGFGSLMLLAYVREDAAGVDTDHLNVRFNGDTGANYDWEQLYGSSGNALATDAAGQTSGAVGTTPGPTAAASRFGTLRMTVANYASTAGYKTVEATWVYIDGTVSLAGVNGVTWRSTAAINRLTLLPGAGNFIVGCRATLYGLP